MIQVVVAPARVNRHIIIRISPAFAYTDEIVSIRQISENIPLVIAPVIYPAVSRFLCILSNVSVLIPATSSHLYYTSEAA